LILALTWDYRNRLSESVAGESEASYIYDANNQRVRQQVGETVTIYPNKYFEDRGGENLKRVYLGSEMLVSIGANNGKHFVHADHLSGSNVVTDSTGEVEQVLDYKPFGEPRVNQQNADYDETKKFTGYESDSSGLSYAGARYYNGRYGKFISHDQVSLDLGMDLERYGKDQNELIKNPQELNPYSYVANNPLRFVDPTGNLRVHTDGASDEEIKAFNDGLNQLTQDVQNSQQIQDYFDLFGVDIVETLTNDKKGPNVYLGGWYNKLSNWKGNRGTYFSIPNKIGLGDSAFQSAEIIGHTLIHELGHWANDIGKKIGELNPKISRFETSAKSNKFDYFGSKIDVVTYLINEIDRDYLKKDSMYGFATQLILYNTLYCK